MDSTHSHTQVLGLAQHSINHRVEKCKVSEEVKAVRARRRRNINRQRAKGGSTTTILADRYIAYNSSVAGDTILLRIILKNILQNHSRSRSRNIKSRI